MSTIAREINGRRCDNLCVAYVVVAGLAAAGTRGISSLDNDEEGEREEEEETLFLNPPLRLMLTSSSGLAIGSNSFWS